MAATGITISRNKVVIPTLRPEVLHRARLLAQFDSLLEKKLIIMTAPAGYGKTVLLVDFARQSQMPVCWLSLDALDQDPQRFIAYLIAAVAERFPAFGKRSSSVLRSVTSLEKDSERLLTSLVNELGDRIDQHFVLVVDDYQFVDFIPPVRDLFSRLISQSGENCHVILATRRLPSLPNIAQMVARQQVGGFDLEELAFRPNEIRLLFEKNYGFKMSEQVAVELVRQTEGWITGLILSANEVAREAPDQATATLWASRMRAARASGVDLGVYLEQQVLSRQPALIRKFLLQSSLLEEFDVDLCKAVLGAGNWKHLLDTVRTSSLFVLPVGPHGKWLRYHHLFADFLRERMLQEFPAEAQVILARLAEVYEERRELEKAFALVKQVGSPEDLAGLVERVGDQVLLNEQLVTLQSWLEELPEALVENRPALLSLKGAFLCGLGGGPAAVPPLDRAVALLQETSDLPVLAQAFVRRAAARRLVGDYTGGIDDADEALRLAGPVPGLEHVTAEALRFKGICFFRLGQAEQALESLEDSLRRYQALAEPDGIARLQMEIGWVCQATGKYDAASQFFRQALSEWKRENNLFSQAGTLNNLSVLYYMEGDYESAVKTLEDGLLCARQGSFRWQEALLMASLGDILCDLDEYDSASQTYALAVGIARQVNYQFLVDYLLLVQARLSRLQGWFPEAHRLLREARPLIQAAGSNYESGLLDLESGCLSLAEGRMPPALSEIRNALDLFQRGDLAAETDWARVWLAAALASSGDGATARSYLLPVWTALSPDGRDSPLVHMLRHAAPWLAQLTSDPQAEPLIKRAAQAGLRLPALRKRLRRMLKAVPLRTSRLSIQTMGKPQVRVNGKLVTRSHWLSASVRDLFFYLLLSPRPLSKDEIGAAFWPEIDPDTLKLRFKNNLYRLRHALGTDVVLFENNLYFFNRHQDYELDVEEFDSHITQARIAGPLEDKLAQLRAATKLWNGSFLLGVDANWAWPERQRLERECLEAFRQLAGLLHQAGDRASALHACRRALEVNPCLEDFHRLAMTLHAEMGDRLAVIWQYQECRKALLAEMDVAPSQETEALYHRLVA
jgi:ATP/maltotriose-dependent transcriptional regulator MalT/two-component SAPR family response regulator